MARSPGNNLRVVAILPFRNLSRDTAQQYFSAGMTEEIATQLSRVAVLRVLSRAATAQYDTAGDRLQRMSREMGVGSVVDGSVRLAGDRVRIAVELTSVRTGQSLWSEQYDRQLSDLFAVQDDVAHKVSAALQARLTPAEAKRVAHVPTSNMAAYQVYLRAQELSPTQRAGNLGPRRAAAAGHRARLRASPTPMPSSRGTTCSGAWRGNGPIPTPGSSPRGRRSRSTPSWPTAGSPSATWRASSSSCPTPGASYLKALELNPSHGGAMADLANVYVALGRFDEALDWSLRNQQLNPNGSMPPTTSAWA